MLKKDEQYKIAKKLFRYFETIVYVEMMRSRRHVPTLEFGNDIQSFHGVREALVTTTSLRGVSKVKKRLLSLIHIGIGFFDAEDQADLFWQIHYILGHELQHAKSTTGKDWKAAMDLCLQDACNKLAKICLGRPSIRLVSDKDYEMFFDELRKNGIFITRDMLERVIHDILNSIEDGRIEMIRCRKHPGFAKYRKLFRSQRWLENDYREGDFSEYADMDSAERLLVLRNEILSLATMNIYSKGFLAMYGGTELYDKVRSLIPEISKAILSPKCKNGMHHARNVFNMILDDVLDTCTTSAAASALMGALKQMEESSPSSSESTYSATPNSEEEGDGLPGESVFGTSDLELELDEEEYEEMLKKMEEDGEDDEDLGGLCVKIKGSSEKDSDSEESEDADSGDTGDGGEGETSEDRESGDGDASGASESGKAGGDSQGGGFPKGSRRA